jgi:hypothetical protein
LHLAILHSHPSKIFSRQQPFFLPRTAASAQGASLSMASPPLPRASSSVRGGQQPRRSASLPCCRSPYRDGEQPCAPCRQAEPPAERAPCPSPGRVPCSTASRKPAPLCISFSHGARRSCSKASPHGALPPRLNGVAEQQPLLSVSCACAGAETPWPPSSIPPSSSSLHGAISPSRRPHSSLRSAPFLLPLAGAQKFQQRAAHVLLSMACSKRGAQLHLSPWLRAPFPSCSAPPPMETSSLISSPQPMPFFFHLRQQAANSISPWPRAFPCCDCLPRTARSSLPVAMVCNKKSRATCSMFCAAAPMSPRGSLFCVAQ